MILALIPCYDFDVADAVVRGQFVCLRKRGARARNPGVPVVWNLQADSDAGEGEKRVEIRRFERRVETFVVRVKLVPIRDGIKSNVPS